MCRVKATAGLLKVELEKKTSIPMESKFLTLSFILLENFLALYIFGIEISEF